MAIGTKLKLELPSRKQPEVPINLLPREIRGEQKTKRYFGYATIGAIALVALLVILTIAQRVQISTEQNTLNEAQARVSALQTQVAALAVYGQLKATVDTKRQTLGTALLGDVSWTRFLDDLDHRIPGDSTLSSLSLSATQATTPDGQVAYGTVQYSGQVKDFPGLAGWLDTMAGARGLHFVYLGSGSKTAGTGTVTFSATANLTSAALSGRCQTETAPCP